MDVRLGPLHPPVDLADVNGPGFGTSIAWLVTEESCDYLAAPPHAFQHGLGCLSIEFRALQVNLNLTFGRLAPTIRRRVPEVVGNVHH